MNKSVAAGRTRRPVRWEVLALLVSLFLGACDDDPGGPDPDAHVGRYEVVSVNGEGLPFLSLVVNGRTTRILAGSVTLRADGSASDSYTFRYTDGLEVIEETTFDEGTYARSGSIIDVTWSSGTVESFTYSGNELTLLDQGFLVRYRK